MEKINGLAIFTFFGVYHRRYFSDALVDDNFENCEICGLMQFGRFIYNTRDYFLRVCRVCRVR